METMQAESATFLFPGVSFFCLTNTEHEAGKKKTKPQRKAVYATQGDAFLKACFCGSKRLMLFDLASVNSTQLFSLECSFKHQVEGFSYAWRARDLKTETFK